MSFRDSFERVRARMSLRAGAYRAVFLNPGGDLGPMAEVVLKDLARYCYVNKPTLKVSAVTQSSDALAMAFAEGRRDVFNRIKAMCHLTDDQINRIAHAKENDQ